LPATTATGNSSAKVASKVFVSPLLMPRTAAERPGMNSRASWPSSGRSTQWVGAGGEGADFLLDLIGEGLAVERGGVVDDREIA
jgi:hypothetical protein